MSTRIVFLSVFVASLVVLTMYSASLTSFMAVKKLKMPFEDIRELYTKSSFEVTTLHESSIVDFLKNGKNGVTQRVHAERLLEVMTVGEAISLAKEGNVAFLWEAPAVESNPTAACHLARVKKKFYSGPVVMATRKGFPYLKAFNYW